MERTMSVEEKIRRAEQIYERRKQGSDKQIATVSVNNEKKDIRLLKKMIVQILICISIYLVIYFINNSEYVFSKDFINKINEILSYDVNFMDLYNTIKDQYNKIIVNNNEDAIYAEIKEVLQKKIKSFSNKQEKYNNSKIITKLEKLLEEEVKTLEI